MASRRDLAAICFLISSVLTIVAYSKDAPRILHKRQPKVTFIAWPAMHSIKLKCKANGSQPLRYLWLKDGKPIHRKLQPTIKTNQWFLRLRELVVSDNGEYTCIVSNSYGQVNHTYTLRVVSKPRSRPMLKCGYPENTTAELHNNVRLRCIVAMSGVLPDFRWLHWKSLPSNYDKLDFKTKQFAVISPVHYATLNMDNEHEYGSELRLSRVTQKDFGLYTCIASNHLGMEYRSAFLTQKHKPKTSPTQVKAQTVSITLKHKTTKRPDSEPSHNMNVDQMSSSNNSPKEPQVSLSIFIGTLAGIVFLLAGFLTWFHYNHKKKEIFSKPTPL